MNKQKILIVDDQPEILNALERLLKNEYKIYIATSGISGLKILKEHPVAVILADQRMPGLTGVDFLAQSLSLQPDAIRILITAYTDVNASIEAINKGQIFYYISKPWEPDDLRVIIKRAVERFQLEAKNRELTIKLKEANARLKHENILLKQNIKKDYDFSQIIGHSSKMLQVFKLASKVIDTPTTVMLLGETGTGKEMLARAIHYNSSRKDKMFIAQNCGALPDSLLESELFGHIRGAFTGATSDHKGLFEIANDGTVFLDEIADTSPALQLSLLRVLQEGEIKPVGSNKTIVVNVRIIAATNKNLEEEVKNNNFREDLYYRLNVFPIHLPPLRKRREDIPELVQHFVQKYTKKINKSIDSISEEVFTILRNADFPGNIRELENEVERAVTLADNNCVFTPDLLSDRFKYQKTEQTISNLGLQQHVEKLEISLIEDTLHETKGNILKAAKILKLSRAGLHKKINRYNIIPKNM